MRSYSTSDLLQYLKSCRSMANAISSHVSSIKASFTEGLSDVFMRYETKVVDIVEQLGDQYPEFGEDLYPLVDERIPTERKIIQARRRSLREDLIEQARQEADAATQESQRQRHNYHVLSTAQQEEQERLKREREILEEELSLLNAKISERAKALGVIRHFFKLRKLTKRRKVVIETLDEVQEQLRDVRKAWKEAQTEMQEEQQRLSAAWEEANLTYSRRQAELEVLDDLQQSEALALKRAVRYVIDQQREPVTYPDAALEKALNDLITLNLWRDAYEDGVGKASHLSALLQGVHKGLGGMRDSVQTLAQQERKYSAHLPKLSIRVTTWVVNFNESWFRLQVKLREPAHYREHPKDFTKLAEDLIENVLTDDNIKRLFEQLGEALNQATEKWR